MYNASPMISPFLLFAAPVRRPFTLQPLVEPHLSARTGSAPASAPAAGRRRLKHPPADDRKAAREDRAASIVRFVSTNYVGRMGVPCDLCLHDPLNHERYAGAGHWEKDGHIVRRR